MLQQSKESPSEFDERENDNLFVNRQNNLTTKPDTFRKIRQARQRAAASVIKAEALQERLRKLNNRS